MGMLGIRTFLDDYLHSQVEFSVGNVGNSFLSDSHSFPKWMFLTYPHATYTFPEFPTFPLFLIDLEFYPVTFLRICSLPLIFRNYHGVKNIESVSLT